MKKTVFLMCFLIFISFLSSCASSSTGGGAEQTDTDITSYLDTSENVSETEVSDTVLSDSASSEADTTLPETTAPDDSTSSSETEVTETSKEETTSSETSGEPITPPDDDNRKVTNHDDIKAIWISQFDLSSVYSSGGAQRDKNSFTKLMKTILDNVKNNGFNTVFLQTRPYADSFYPSEYYPPSRFTVGKYGNGFKYDPIEIIVALARERGLSIHAWINPLRCMTEGEIAYVPDNYAVKKWYNDPALRGKYIVKSGTYLYLNPAYKEVRELILNGAREVMTNYGFDGLHMDDYFYPTTSESFDSDAYASYIKDGGSKSLADYRRENLNKLISAMYDVTKSVNPSLLYGISPAGNWNTVYNSHYADYKTWCGEEGYIDYICPQVYFGLEHGSYDFVKTSAMWQSFIKTDSVKLIIGMTLGKAKSGVDEYAGAGKYEWQNNKDVIKRCILSTASLDKCTGISIFCYQYFYNPISGADVTETLTERNNFVPTMKDISWGNN